MLFMSWDGFFGAPPEVIFDMGYLRSELLIFGLHCVRVETPPHVLRCVPNGERVLDSRDGAYHQLGDL